jgi:hypothetical protein
MSTQHIGVGLVAGDDWEIQVTMLDENDVPFDLTAAQILWCLMDSTYHRVIETDEVTIALDDALAGECSILIPATATTKLPAGFYTDTLRIVTGGITSTLLFGQINVMADPWGMVAVQTTGHKIVPFQRTLADHDRERLPA